MYERKKRNDSFKPVIIHFPAAIKPWHFMSINPYKKEYWKYLKMTPFRDYHEPDKSIKNAFKKCFSYIVFQIIIRAVKKMAKFHE